MDDQRIWAPWRIGYITQESDQQTPPEPCRWQPDAAQDCFLCRLAAEYQDPAAANRQNLVIATGKQSVAVLNRYPYNNGHLLVSPLRHVRHLHELTTAEHLEAMQMLSDFTKQLSTLIRAEGFNIGLNLGTAAGAGVPGHLHWHLVPRWSGDGNFMPTIAGTRVIPQSLDALWELLTDESQ